MKKMTSQRRSLAAALDMVEAAISSLENQATQAKVFQEQQKLHQVAAEGRLEQALLVQSPQPSAASCDAAPITDPVSVNSKAINKDQAKLDDAVDTSKENCKRTNGHQILTNSLHKRNKARGKLRTAAQPGVLLHHRSSTPRKKSHKRPAISPTKPHRSAPSSKRERNNNNTRSCADNSSTGERNNSGDGGVATSLVERKLTRNSIKTCGYSQPTLASRMKEQSVERPKTDKTVIPFVPVGTQGKSYHVGVIIQNKLGQLKSQPLEVWAAAKHNAAKKEAGDV